MQRWLKVILVSRRKTKMVVVCCCFFVLFFQVKFGDATGSSLNVATSTDILSASVLDTASWPSVDE